MSEGEKKKETEVSKDTIKELREFWKGRFSGVNEAVRTLLISTSIFFSVFAFTFSLIAKSEKALELLKSWFWFSFGFAITAFLLFLIALLAMQEPKGMEELYSRSIWNEKPMDKFEVNEAEKEAKGSLRWKKALSVVGACFLASALLSLLVPFAHRLYGLLASVVTGLLLIAAALYVIIAVRRKSLRLFNKEIGKKSS